MRKVATDFDSTTGISESFYYDEQKGKVLIEKKQNVTPILDLNKEMYSRQTRPSYSDSNGNHLVARIPLTVIDLWIEQGFNWFQSTDKERRAWLDKPENEVFKTRPGKLNGVTKTNLTYKNQAG